MTLRAIDYILAVGTNEEVYKSNNDESKSKGDTDMVDNRENEVTKKSWLKTKVKMNWKKKMGSLADNSSSSSFVQYSANPGATSI